jgi:hypothetical protein
MFDYLFSLGDVEVKGCFGLEIGFGVKLFSFVVLDSLDSLTEGVFLLMGDPTFLLMGELISLLILKLAAVNESFYFPILGEPVLVRGDFLSDLLAETSCSRFSYEFANSKLTNILGSSSSFMPSCPSYSSSSM